MRAAGSVVVRVRAQSTSSACRSTPTCGDAAAGRARGCGAERREVARARADVEEAPAPGAAEVERFKRRSIDRRRRLVEHAASRGRVDVGVGARVRGQELRAVDGAERGDDVRRSSGAIARQRVRHIFVGVAAAAREHHMADERQRCTHAGRPAPGPGGPRPGRRRRPQHVPADAHDARPRRRAGRAAPPPPRRPTKTPRRVPRVAVGLRIRRRRGRERRHAPAGAAGCALRRSLTTTRPRPGPARCPCPRPRPALAVRPESGRLPPPAARPPSVRPARSGARAAPGAHAASQAGRRRGPLLP